VDVVGLTSGVASIAAGGNHTCAVTAQGGLKCWGWNGEGQLGDGTTTDRTTPVNVAGLAAGVAAVSAGGYHTCAQTVTGGLSCWGANFNGQLGDGTTVGHATPVGVSGLAAGVVGVAAGWFHTCAITTGGGVKCWGWNQIGQLGDGTNTDRHTPADVSGLPGGVVVVTIGYSHTCAATDTGGAWCWGQQTTGKLGDGTAVDRYTPIGVCGDAGCNSPLYDVADIAAGAWHTCAVTTSGHGLCWGDNERGEVGDGTTADRWTPASVIGPIGDMVDVGAGDYFTCARTERGGVLCWGSNDNGRLGDGTTVERHYPAEVVGLGPKPEGVVGDADCSGVVNSIDAALILQLVAGLVASLPCQDAADANDDGSIDAVDAALVLQFTAGLIPGLPPAGLISSLPT
jgi:alpha-tubulin suppressor-like RCC1 family protein